MLMISELYGGPADAKGFRGHKQLLPSFKPANQLPSAPLFLISPIGLPHPMQKECALLFSTSAAFEKALNWLGLQPIDQIPERQSAA